MFENHYRTEDIYESAYLITQGMERIKKEKKGDKWTIYFRNPDACEEHSLKYFDCKENNINARAFVDNYRMLKRYIFQ